jgi:hypothetical protein
MTLVLLPTEKAVLKVPEPLLADDDVAPIPTTTMTIVLPLVA